MVVLGTDNGKENFCREHAELPAHNNGVAEISHALNETDQEGIGQTGLEQRQSHRHKGAMRISAQGLGRLFQRRRNALHHAAHDHEGNGRERKRLRNPHAKPTIEPTRGLDAKSPFQALIDHTCTAKQQNQTKANDERRRDDRQHGQNIEWFVVALASALGHQGHQSA